MASSSVEPESEVTNFLLIFFFLFLSLCLQFILKMKTSIQRFQENITGVADKYNVETAEILANSALVRFRVTCNVFFLIFFYLFSSVQFNSISPVIDNILFLFFLQHLPVAQAAPIYEQLLSVFPTAVSFIVIVVRIISGTL